MPVVADISPPVVDRNVTSPVFSSSPGLSAAGYLSFRAQFYLLLAAILITTCWRVCASYRTTRIKKPSWAYTRPEKAADKGLPSRSFESRRKTKSFAEPELGNGATSTERKQLPAPRQYTASSAGPVVRYLHYRQAAKNLHALGGPFWAPDPRWWMAGPRSLARDGSTKRKGKSVGGSATTSTTSTTSVSGLGEDRGRRGTSPSRAQAAATTPPLQRGGHLSAPSPASTVPAEGSVSRGVSSDIASTASASLISASTAQQQLGAGPSHLPPTWPGEATEPVFGAETGRRFQQHRQRQQLADPTFAPSHSTHVLGVQDNSGTGSRINPDGISRRSSADGAGLGEGDMELDESGPWQFRRTTALPEGPHRPKPLATYPLHYDFSALPRTSGSGSHSGRAGFSHLSLRPPPLPSAPLTPPMLASTAFYTFEDRKPGYAVSIPPELDANYLDASFIHQPNPDYLVGLEEHGNHGPSLTRQHAMSTESPDDSLGELSQVSGLSPIAIGSRGASPRSAVADARQLNTETQFFPSSYPQSSPLLPPPPPSHSTFGPIIPGSSSSQNTSLSDHFFAHDADGHAAAHDVTHGEILSVTDADGQGWRRHTRVFGGGVCLACMAGGEDGEGGFYGDKVLPEEKSGNGPGYWVPEQRH